jgi:iron-sulfur cluster repair protein YtfE (RIC family)
VRKCHLRLESGNDLPPRCRTVLEAIGRLEAHLHEYMFLENCILFPRAVALQEQMTAA